jgi:hypothetical protein
MVRKVSTVASQLPSETPSFSDYVDSCIDSTPGKEATFSVTSLFPPLSRDNSEDRQPRFLNGRSALPVWLFSHPRMGDRGGTRRGMSRGPEVWLA